MKNLQIILLSVAIMISFTQCNTPTPDKLCSDAETRGKIISTLINNDVYMNEVMDSMSTRHPEVVLATVFVMAKSDKEMPSEMMNHMMEMCNSDSIMCKMMMSKTMEMCDTDQSKCDMMSGMMMEHKPIMTCMMNSMHETGMMDKSCMEKGMMNMKGDTANIGGTEGHFKHN